MTPPPPLVTKRFTAALAKDGRARRRAAFVIPSLDGRAVFTELATGREHEQAYVVFLGTAVAAKDVLAKMPQNPLAASPAALGVVEAHIRQVTAIPLGSVVGLQADSLGGRRLAILARHARRPPQRRLPG